MFGIGLSEFIVILIMALIFVGPDKLPQLARTLGKAFSEFRKAGEEVKKSFNEAARPEKKAVPEADEEKMAEDMGK